VTETAEQESGGVVGNRKVAVVGCYWPYDNINGGSNALLIKLGGKVLWTC
jgi:hypothetical protein